MSEQLIKVDPGKLAIFGNAAVNDKFSAGIRGGEFLPKISIKGREFALVISGERKRLPSPQDRNLPVVIVDARASVSKEFYENPWGQGGNAEAKAPDCSSADGITPDAGVAKMQSPTCQLCPHNAWKSGSNGKGKRCGDHKVLVVLPANKLDAQPFQLRVPAASLKAFGAYVRQLSTHGIPVNGAVTNLSFADKEYPELEFTFVDTLQSQADFELVLKAAERVDVKDVLRGIVVKQEEHASQQPVAIQPAVKPAAATLLEATLAMVPAPTPEAGTSSEVEDVISGWLSGGK